MHPYLPAADLLARYTPLADALGRAVGRPIIVRVGRSYSEQIDAIGTDSVDIAYLGAAPYVVMVARYGPKPILARQVVHGDPMVHGSFIVRQDSRIQSLKDLKGKRFAYADAQSTSGHIVPVAMLEREGVPESALASSSSLGSHRNVALAVLAGDYDAGAVEEEVFEEFRGKGLRSLARELPVPEHLLVTSTKLAPALREALRGALLHLQDLPEGKAVLSHLQPDFTQFVPGRDSDYDVLRVLMHRASPAPH